MSKKINYAILGIIVIILITLIFLSLTQFQNPEKKELENLQAVSPPVTQNTSQTSKEKSDVILSYPIRCNASMGFDNYRTEQAFAINPKNNQEMYINVEYRGFYKSVDGGKTWNFSGKGIKALPRSDDPTKPCRQLHFSLYLDPSDSQRILLPGGSAPGRVGEGLGGLVESLDGGKSWHQLFTQNMSAYTENVVTDTKNNAIYVTTAALSQESSGPDQGKLFISKGIVYKSIDGGKNWEELPTEWYPHLRATGLFIDSINPENILIATLGLPSGSNVDKKSTTEQWGFIETKDGGKTWSKLESTKGIGVRYVDVSPISLNRFYMLASKDDTDKVYYSLDGTLIEANTPVNFARYDPYDKTGMRLIGFSLYAQPDDLYESFDGGQTWNMVGKLPQGITNSNRASHLVFDPFDRNTIYINADRARLWKSTDKGKTWENLLDLEKLPLE